MLYAIPRIPASGVCFLCSRFPYLFDSRASFIFRAVSEALS
jgi:hypothetical protein